MNEKKTRNPSVNGGLAVIRDLEQRASQIAGTHRRDVHPLCPAHRRAMTTGYASAGISSLSMSKRWSSAELRASALGLINDPLSGNRTGDLGTAKSDADCAANGITGELL
jgi:hypothetical protein